MIRPTLSLALALSLTAPLALAQEAADTDGAEAGMEGMDHSDMAMEDIAPGMQGYIAAMNTMMEVMPSDSTGDPDADFLLMMIPHHQSAIDMARIVLEVGDDPEVLALAQQVIDSQEAEVLAMREMLARMDVEPAAAVETVTTDDSGMAEEPAATEGEASE